MKQLLFVCFCICMLSCNILNPQGDHIPPAKMEKILDDLQMAEMYSTMVAKDTGAYKGPVRNIDSLAHYYKVILAHYNVTINELNKSLDWYRNNPEQLDSVYTHMIPQLTSLQTVPVPPSVIKPATDSIKDKKAVIDSIKNKRAAADSTKHR